MTEDAFYQTLDMHFLIPMNLIEKVKEEAQIEMLVCERQSLDGFLTSKDESTRNSQCFITNIYIANENKNKLLRNRTWGC